MNETIDKQLTEYRQQREQLKRQLDAVDGAIQALERLREAAKSEGVKEHDNGNRTDSDTTRHSE